MTRSADKDTFGSWWNAWKAQCDERRGELAGPEEQLSEIVQLKRQQGGASLATAARPSRARHNTNEQSIAFTELTVTMITEDNERFRLAFTRDGTGTFYQDIVNRDGVVAAASGVTASGRINNLHLLPLDKNERRRLADWLLRYVGRK